MIYLLTSLCQFTAVCLSWCFDLEKFCFIWGEKNKLFSGDKSSTSLPSSMSTFSDSWVYLSKFSDLLRPSLVALFAAYGDLESIFYCLVLNRKCASFSKIHGIYKPLWRKALKNNSFTNLWQVYVDKRKDFIFTKW